MEKLNLQRGKLAIILAFSSIFFSCGDDDDEEGPTGLHHQGVSCMQCHSPENAPAKADGYVLKMAGTIFKVLNAPDYDVNNAATYHTVKLVFEDGTPSVIASKGWGSGNFYSNANIPEGVKFTVEVLDPNGQVVNKSNEFSHDAGRLDCNRCHTAEGLDGAPGRIVNYDYYAMPDNTGATTLSFKDHIYPILETKCQSCHNPNGSASNTRFVFTTSDEAYASIMNNSLIDVQNPPGSLLLKKATNTVTHEGGKVIDPDSPEYKTLLDWISQGANP